MQQTKPNAGMAEVATATEIGTEEIHAVFDAFNKTRNGLEAILVKLEAAAQDIDIADAIAGRAAPTPTENAKLKIIDKQQADLRLQIRGLAREAAKKMAGTSDFAQLLKELKDIEAPLKQTLADLQKDVKIASDAQQAADAFDKIVSGVIKLASGA